MNESDERYCIAEDAIFDAFFLLLKEKSIEKVTVSDVIKRAGIVRSTFYNHYENIPALMTAAEDRTIGDIFKLMESFHPQNDKDMCRSYFLVICNYTRKNPFLANLLQSGGGNSFFEKAILMFHEYVSKVSRITPVEDHRSVNERSYFIAGAIGSTIGILHKWTAEDFSSPAETVADILSDIFLAGILPYLNSNG